MSMTLAEALAENWRLDGYTEDEIAEELLWMDAEKRGDPQ